MPLPWSPLYTLERSGLPEVTVHGVLCVTIGENTPLIEAGNIDFPLWSRSLLKPWQLLSLMPTLEPAYPTLETQHLALMLASPSGEPEQHRILREVLTIGNLETGQLQCPACYPLSAEAQAQLKAEGKPPAAFYHPCCGKHLAMLLAVNAQQLDSTGYLAEDNPAYRQLKRLLAVLLWRANDDFPVSRDGCGMPNYALTAEEMAGLFMQLAHPHPTEGFEDASSDIQSFLEHYPTIRDVMHTYPELVGGTGRLDTALMRGTFTDASLRLVAKEGADGLLGVGIAPCTNYPNGIGILLKLASGYDPAMMRVVIAEVLRRLGLSTPDVEAEEGGSVIKTRFHFALTVPQEV